VHMEGDGWQVAASPCALEAIVVCALKEVEYEARVAAVDVF